MLCFPSHHQHMTWGWLGGNEMVFLIICREKRESRELGMNIQFRPLQDVLLGLIIRRCIKWKLLFLCCFIHIDWFVSLYYKMCVSQILQQKLQFILLFTTFWFYDWFLSILREYWGKAASYCVVSQQNTIFLLFEIRQTWLSVDSVCP